MLGIVIGSEEDKLFFACIAFIGHIIAYVKFFSNKKNRHWVWIFRITLGMSIFFVLYNFDIQLKKKGQSNISIEKIEFFRDTFNNNYAFFSAIIPKKWEQEPFFSSQAIKEWKLSTEQIKNVQYYSEGADNDLYVQFTAENWTNSDKECVGYDINDEFSRISCRMDWYCNENQKPDSEEDIEFHSVIKCSIIKVNGHQIAKIKRKFIHYYFSNDKPIEKKIIVTNIIDGNNLGIEMCYPEENADYYEGICEKIIGSIETYPLRSNF